MSNNGEDRRMPPMSGAVQNQNVEATATGAIAIANPPSNPGGYMTFENCGPGDIHIVFGDAAVTAPTTTTNAGLIPSGQARDWYIARGVTHFNAIGSAAGCKLRAWKSSP